MPESQSDHSNVPPVAIESPECPSCTGPMILSRNKSEPVYFCDKCDDTLRWLFGGPRSHE
jgi:transposase-like protein